MKIQSKICAGVGAISAAALLAMATSSSAATIINGSFESVNLSDPRGFVWAGDPGLIGWTVNSDYINYTGWQAAHGVRSIDLAGGQNTSISQMLETVAGQRYAVTFAMAGNPDGGPNLKTLVASVNGAPSQTYTFLVGPGTSRSNMGWRTFTYRFTASGDSSLLTFAAANNPNTAYGPALDKVSIAAIPEPATWAMMIIGFGAVGSVVRRQRRQSVVSAA